MIYNLLLKVPFSVLICFGIQIGWILFACFRFATRNDEVPVVVSGFLFYCGSYRMMGSYLGMFEFLSLESFGLGVAADFNNTLVALMLLCFGETVLITAYCLVLQDLKLKIREIPMPPVLRERLRQVVLLLASVGIVGTYYSRIYVDAEANAGKSLAFEVSSYAQNFPMVLIAAAIFIFLAWRFGAIRNLAEKGLAIAALCLIANLTFQISGRFQFLGWILGGTYIVSTLSYGVKRIPYLMAGVVAAFLLFSYAGALRDTNEDDAFAAGLERSQKAEDANMLDGLAFMMQVYPQYLPFEYGMGHFEILERPIPRAWWPGKPVGGYMNKLGMFDATTGTIGISPTLFGSFYEEGGWMAVFIFSVIYAYAFAQLIRFSQNIRPVFGVLLRACFIGGLVPLLRGGDLPGIYAWLGMAFWPVILFLKWNQQYLKIPKTMPFPGRHLTAFPQNKMPPSPVQELPNSAV